MKTRNKRGAILITTVILGIAVAIGLGSFIALTVQASKLSNSSFSLNSALNLAEAGLESAMSSINRSDWSGWSNYSGSSANKTKSLPTFDLGSGTTGHVNVVVFGATSSPTPRIVAQGRTEGNLGSSVRKQIEVRLRRRSHFATGMVAKDLVTFSGGNAYVDSYNSEDPAYSTAGQYDPAKKRDRGSVASARVEVTTDGVAIGNGNVWGYAATGGSDVDVGSTGSIKGADTPSGVRIDTSRITKDFSANFDIETAPDSGFTSVYANVTSSTTFGTAGATSKILAANLTANNSGDVFTVAGDVTMVVTGNITIKGSIIVTPGSSLTLYLAGDGDIGGNGIVNQTNVPKNVVIYGTDTVVGGQTIKLHGNGILQAAVYAPNAHIELKGGGAVGEMSGSVIGYDIKMTGNYKFHYDEALAELSDGNPWAVGLWREITRPADMVSF
jgi:Tfp pilus assembly protein PilX